MVDTSAFRNRHVEDPILQDALKGRVYVQAGDTTVSATPDLQQIKESGGTGNLGKDCKDEEERIGAHLIWWT